MKKKIETVTLQRRAGESEQAFLERYFGVVEPTPTELGEPDEQYLIETEEEHHD